MSRNAAPARVVLTFKEIAAVIASLVALGPNRDAELGLAMRAILQAIAPPAESVGSGDAAPMSQQRNSRPHQ